MSRSPRSVWVEITLALITLDKIIVTLPTERVSWNNICVTVHNKYPESRSPRSVWVEIPFLFQSVFLVTSRSPRSVWVEISVVLNRRYTVLGHAPHGACELKCVGCNQMGRNCTVTLPTERVSWNYCKERFYTFLCVTLPTERVSWNHA